MNKKALLLCGVPGTGKTTITKRMIEVLGGFSSFEIKEPIQLVRLMESDKLVIIGTYDDSDDVFQGGDRLSMAVQPKFQEYVEQEQPERLFIEGDRLVGNKTIDFLLEQDYEVLLFQIQAPKELLKERYEQRGSNQPEQFLKAKETKISNMTTRMDLLMDDAILSKFNRTSEELEENVKLIIDFIND